MRKILFPAACALLLASCGGSSKDNSISDKTAANVDLKAFMNLLNKPFSDAQSYFKNNIDTTVVERDSIDGDHNILVVELNDNSIPNAAPVLGIIETGGTVSECEIINGNSVTSQTEQALGTEYANLAEKDFGEVSLSFIAKQNATSPIESWTTLQDLWSYINTNGYSGFDEYVALWIYGGNSCLVGYDSEPLFSLLMEPGDVTKEQGYLPKVNQKIMKAIHFK